MGWDDHARHGTLEMFQGLGYASSCSACWYRRCRCGRILASGKSTPSQLPRDFTLDRNHPNPFNPGTVIPFSLGHDGYVRMSVHDVLGREVALLVNEVRSSGRYGEYFDATNLPSVTYIYRLVFEGKTQSRSMMLMR